MQRSVADAAETPALQPEPAAPPAPMPELLSYASIQRMFGNKIKPGGGPDVRAAATQGISGPSCQLPHLDQIQRSFGKHDISHVQAHTGSEAAAGFKVMGADAFTTGDHVAFAGAPSVHLAAHEAAHVMQQRGGVQLSGGVGETGDTYEQHADQVADLGAEQVGRGAAGPVRGRRDSWKRLSWRRTDSTATTDRGPQGRRGVACRHRRPFSAGTCGKPE